MMAMGPPGSGESRLPDSLHRAEFLVMLQAEKFNARSIRPANRLPHRSQFVSLERES